jgi:hypothetical protein
MTGSVCKRYRLGKTVVFAKNHDRAISIAERRRLAGVAVE